MRFLWLAFALFGCASSDAELDTAALWGALENYDGPPPGVNQRRYTLDCTSLEPPRKGAWGYGGYHELAVFSVLAPISNYRFDADHPPVGAMIVRIIDPEHREWIDSHKSDDDPGPPDLWSAEIRVDEVGRALGECLFLATCVGDCDDTRPDELTNQPLYGWITSQVELIVWE